ncbi:CMGC protein kinase [Aspergillus sclerotialis]|uniref:non-specific serine/threonine protein kinase n=1 Tax=Aspergillus sclerotialis TaxID=2070753 RepID=A0A3A2ZI35_9EURO|nr:CMGC protein kinase [Aspergillus sclerotialis]
MAYFTKRTLNLTNYSRLSNILPGLKTQATVLAHSKARLPSLRLANTSFLKAFATKLPDSTSILDSIEKPRSLPTGGFKIIEANQQVEEEELPDYRADRFYPVQLGEVFQYRYQVIAKLGFGSSSTTWLARDLRHLGSSPKPCRARQYIALKLYVHTSLVHRELPSYRHVSRLIADSSREGRSNIRILLDSFEVTGPHGNHIVLIFEAAQMSLRDMKLVFRLDGFDEDFVRGAIIELLKALDFLHTQGELIHTDVHSGNMLLGVLDNNLLQTFEEKEFSNPVPRKPVSSTRTIYLSRLMRPKEGPMLLSDFGEARIGPGPHGGDIMPLAYRAPETLLYVGWSYPVDIWSVGLTAWDLLQPNKLFTARDEDGDLYDAAHLAQMIAALGPPPSEFLAKNPERKADFWGEQGEWLGLAPIPVGRTMEALETRLQDKTGFLGFIRKALTWMPEDRATAKELLRDPWLTGENA